MRAKPKAVARVTSIDAEATHRYRPPAAPTVLLVARNDREAAEFLRRNGHKITVYNIERKSGSLWLRCG